MKSYAHLSDEERFFIHIALREGKNKKQIALSLKRHPSTIGREIKRGMWPRSILYCYDWGTYKNRARKRYKQFVRKRKITPEIALMVESLLKNYLSPQQISSYLSVQHQIQISHETIYQYIHADPERKKALRPYLRQLHKKRRKAYGSGARASNIPNRRSITQRPAIVEEKGRIGDWECDTVIGGDRQSALVTVVERKTLFTLTKKVNRKTAKNVSDAMISLLKPYKDFVHTLTFDNGSEFVRHERIGKAVGAETYFAHPYSSWERGINENTNGLLRQFFPKGTDFTTVSWREVKEALYLLNNRPRKTRGYKTPSELFLGEFNPLI